MFVVNKHFTCRSHKTRAGNLLINYCTEWKIYVCRVSDMCNWELMIIN